MTAPVVVRRPGLATVLVRIDRAKLHLADYEARTKPYLAECLRAVIHEYDEQRSEYVLRIGQIPAIPHDLSAILGDAIHNLRISLDYLAWQLALATGQQPGTGTFFPVRETPGTAKDGSRLLPDIQPGMPQHVRTLLDQVQPYQYNHPHNHQLAVLHRLDIADKHHDLLATIIDAKSVGWFGDANPTAVNQGPYEDGSVICRFKVPADSVGEPRRFTVTPSFDLCVREDGAGAWSKTPIGASGLVRILLKYVEEEVVPRLRSYF